MIALWGTVMLTASVVHAGPQSVCYVSPKGDDGWTGALQAPNVAGTDGPVRSLHRARDVVRAFEAGVERKIVLAGGTYHLDELLVLGPEDSGTAERPVIWTAQEGETVTLSGGRPITGWTRGEDGVWKAVVPEARDGQWPIRQLRVGDEMQTLARHPNAVPDDPYKGGWLFARPKLATAGAFGSTVANIHTPGDWIEWEIDAPTTGEYALWVRYGALNAPFGRTDMAGRTTFQIDGGESIPLESLPDTGGWQSFSWSRCAALPLTEGRRVLRWTNRQGGGINLDAFAVCDDLDWTPQGTDLAPPAEGRHVMVIQAEAWKNAQGREMTRDLSYPATPDVLPFGEGDIPPDWDLTGADVMIFPAWGWVGGPIPVGGVDWAECQLTLTGQNAQQKIERGNRYYLRNVRQALDQPGEFYCDDRAGELSYIPKSPGFEAQGVVAPLLDRIIEVSGSAEDDSWPEHIHFRGLSFKDTTYSPGIKSLYQDPDAAIWIRHARNVVIEGCTFSQLGGNAVNFALNANGCKVLGCTMTEMGGGGVIMTGEKAADQPTNCVVAGCTMSFLGRIYKHVAGVYVTTGSGHRVAYNTITDVPRYAISFKSYNAESYSHDNVAEYNEMLRTNLETNDTGAIETLGRDRQPSGNIIRDNLILDVVGMKHLPEGGLISPFYTWGIYLDDHSSGTQIVGNIVARTYRGSYHNHLGFDNVVENNVFVDGFNQQAEYNGAAEMRNNAFSRNIVVWNSPEATYLRSGGWDRAVLSECDNNVVWSTAEDLAASTRALTPEGPWAQWLEAGFDAHSRLADPLFVDAARDDYRLRPESPALALGFQPIPVERIGVRGYRAEEWR